MLRSPPIAFVQLLFATLDLPDELEITIPLASSQMQLLCTYPPA